MQCADDVLRVLVGGDILRHVGRESVDVRIECRRVLAPRVLDGQLFNIERAIGWRVSRKVERSDRIVVQIFLPVLNDLIGSDAQLCRILGRRASLPLLRAVVSSFRTCFSPMTLRASFVR